MTRSLLVLLFSFSVFFCISQSSITRSGSVVFSQAKNGYEYVEGLVPNAPVQGSYSDHIDETGWGTLEITTNSLSDEQQAYWLGFIEGVLTYDRIYQHYQNIFSLDFGGNPPSADLVNWVTNQKKFLEDGVATYGTNPDPSDSLSVYWFQVSLLLNQFSGLVDGYNSMPTPSISDLDLWLLNSDGDLETLLDMYPQGVEKGSRRRKQSGDEEEYTDCSALIKLVAQEKKKSMNSDSEIEYDDLLSGHTTWRSYAAMLRIYKFYHSQFSSTSGVAANSVAFSASPGFLSSKDDWYITSAGLVSLETTNSIYDEDLYVYVVPQTVLTWQRSILCNRLSETSSQWVNCFAGYNSGTYNNQWMVVDYKVFDDIQQSKKKPTKAESQGLLSIIEQIPGTTQIGDVSDVLIENGYWASYNVPYFENIYNLSGYPARYEQYGDKYSYSNCSRAKIFRRDQPSVLDIEDMKRMLRYNDFQNDPDSEGNPTNAISSRYDLKTNITVHDAFGGVDTKLTSSDLVSKLSGWAQSGPTHDQQPVFSWTNWTKTLGSEQPLHVGHPESFDFDFQFFAPAFFTPRPSEEQPFPSPIFENPIYTPIFDVIIDTIENK